MTRWDGYFFYYLDSDYPVIYDSLLFGVIFVLLCAILYYAHIYTSYEIKKNLLYIILASVGVYFLYYVYKETRPGWRQRADGVWVGNSRRYIIFSDDEFYVSW